MSHIPSLNLHFLIDPQTTGSRDMSQRSRKSHPREKGGQRDRAWSKGLRVWGWLLQMEGDCAFQLRVHWSDLQRNPVHIHGGLHGRQLSLPSPKSTSWEPTESWSHWEVLHSGSFFFFFFSLERPAHHLGGLVWMVLQTPGQMAVFQLKHRVSWIFFQISFQTIILACYL